MNAGSDLDSITFPSVLMWAIEWDLENILSVFGNDGSFLWGVIQLDYNSSYWYRAFRSLWARSDDLLASQSRFERFVKLCKRLKIDLAFTQPSGLTSLHWMIEQASGDHISDVMHCLSVLISNGVDPCAICDGYLTPTLEAFFQDKLDLWFTVLRQSGISVEAVAAHTIGLLVGDIMSRIILELSDPFWYITHSSILGWSVIQGDGTSPFEVTKRLGVALIEAFERQGCYLNGLGERGNMITYKASSSVYFTPSTVYDPERAKLDFRRRTGARKNPQ